jgi:hypothetical protein
MTEKEYTNMLIHKIMFSTSLTHLDEIKEVAHLIVDEIKLNSLDKASKYFNGVKKEIDKL